MIEIPKTIFKSPAPIKGRVALIDGDILVYRSAFSCQRKLYDLYYNTCVYSGWIDTFTSKPDMYEYIKTHELEDYTQYVESVVTDPLGMLYWNIKSTYDSILKNSKSETAEIYLTESKTFRHNIATTKPYKGGRPGKPELYLEARNSLVYGLKAKTCGLYEADDMLAIRATELGHKGIICSIDKDLRQVPGWHYNIVTQELDKVSPKDGWKSLFKQVLIGDAVDNIDGCYRVGQVRAAKLAEKWKKPQDAYDDCFDLFTKTYGYVEGLARLDETISLVYILRGYNDDWSQRLRIRQPDQ